ncbi:hypothetical protein LTR85_010937 [Meristemomyces frigidus]|nr:hypothetical protein LTR85_010937 [Meristemomyces frigidus]
MADIDSMEKAPYDERLRHDTDDRTQERAELHPNHPMLWPSWLRHACLLQLAFNAMMNGFTSSILIPGFPIIAEKFGVSEAAASYLTSVHVLFLGLGPLIWAPICDKYGRRLCLILAMLLSFAANIGGAYARSYGTLMAARIFQSIGISFGNVCGAAIVVELFSAEHRAAKLNVWSVMVTAGPAIGGLVGGFLIAALGWQWALYLNAICNAAEMLAYIFCFPETQWVPSNPIGLKARMRFPVNHSRRLRPSTFLQPLLFFQSPVLVIMLFVFGVSFGIISVGLSVTLPAVFPVLYGFSPQADGLVFVAYVVGALVGGQLGGWLSDVIVRRYAAKCEREGRHYRHEYRLFAVIPGYFLAVIGLILYGVTLQEATHWSGPVIAFGIAECGLQIIINVINTYCVDCYRTHSLTVTVFLNILRQVVGFTAGFWIPPLIAATGYGLGVGILAIMCFCFYVLSTVVFVRGEELRQRFPVRGLS